MEYADAINSATFTAAVSLARELQLERSEPVAQSAADAVSRTFCACVTDGEDDAEHRFSAIHRQLIDEVIVRVRSAENSIPKGTFACLTVRQPPLMLPDNG